MKRHVLNKEKSEHILSLDYDALDNKKIKLLTTSIYDKETKTFSKYCDFTDELVIPTNHTFFKNSSPIVTTVGRYIVNIKLRKEEPIKSIIGLINEPITKGFLGGMYSKLGEALVNDKVTAEELGNFYTRTEWFFNFTMVSTPSFTEKIYKPDAQVMKRKKELLKEFDKEIKDGDVVKGVEIRDELLELARSKMFDDIGADIYKSGALGSFDNNYGNLNVMRGVVKDEITNSFSIVTNNLIDGVKKEDLTALANAAVKSAYNKGVGVRSGGYNTKKNLAAFQSIVLDEQGTDCGTKLTQPITINKSNSRLLVYSYIVENGKLVLLDKENISKYMGKTVNMRSPLYCKTDKVCNSCAGTLFYDLDIKNVGLNIIKESSSLLNKFMKTFHDNSIKIYTMQDPNEFIT